MKKIEINYNDYKFEIMDIDNKIITKVRVTKIEESILVEDEKDE